MKFAVIGDIHGNKYALEAVLDDIFIKNVDFIISTGDLVGYFPFSNEVISMIRQNNIMVVKGNHDETIANGTKTNNNLLSQLSNDELAANASRLYINNTITDENRDFLKNLSSYFNLSCGEFNIKFVHGSPFKINEYLYEDDEILSSIADKTSENVIICGHTHLAYHKQVNDTHFINSGSVGKPKHGNSNASYVVVSITSNTLTTNIYEVSYDVSPLIEDIRANNMISNTLIASLLEGK